MKGFFKIVGTLIPLTKKDTSFIYFSACQNAFNKLRKCFTLAPILYHIDLVREVVVEMDTSDLVVPGILSQYDEEGILHPVTYLSRKYLPVEINYEIYDKEPLMIIYAFKE
jgi:hypothetical protein